MKKANVLAALSFVILLLLSGVAIAHWDPADGHKMHYPQLPDPMGWDVNATTPLIVADDWQCSETGYVKDIHFWGSWKDISLPPDGQGDPGTIIGFILSIYTNDPGPPSKPLELLWQATITSFTVTPALFGDQGWYDPEIPEVIRPDHQEYYLYNIFLEEADWFEQIQGEIYWLSISAQVQGTFPQPLWGWKTSLDHFMDDSVWGSYVSQPINWYELINPQPPYESLDQAFVINGEPLIGACCYPDPTGGGSLCIETTQSDCENNLLGNYQGDGTVCLGIAACCLQDGSCVDVDEICCDDLGGTSQGPGTVCTTPEGCCLPDGTCQDLDPLCCDDQGGTPQGAGTACTATEACCFSDGSCQDLDPLCCDDQGGSPSPTGAPACLGDGNQNGTDDACEEEEPPELKWLQPPDLSVEGMDVSAFNVPPYDPYVLADDFLCQMTGPLTRAHIWGSWYQDNLPGDPGDPMAVSFTLSIHEDIPANESPFGYSIPGETLWICQPPFVLGEVIPGLMEGWLEPPSYYDPPGADTICFEYVFDLTPCPPFIQQGTEQQPVIYWLDVQAQPIDPQNDAFFGWKTSMDHWNDDAVWINGTEPIPAISSWQELRYPPGHPLYDASIDLAFALYGYDLTDRDQDGVPDANDNCPDYPNGPLLGTCTKTTFYNYIVSTGQYCTVDGDCDPGEYCEKWQADNYPPGGNGIGDACDCEGDFDCSGGVDAGDVGPFLADWNHRTIYSDPCTNGDQCNGDFNCNRGVGADDVGKFLEDWNHRTIYSLPCPPCAGGTYHPWCAYP